MQQAVSAGTTTAAVQAAPAVPQAVTAAMAPDSTADKIRSLVNVAVAPKTDATGLDAQTLANARKFETLAIIQAGVQDLVTAVVPANTTSTPTMKMMLSMAAFTLPLSAMKKTRPSLSVFWPVLPRQAL
ncbi:hypothetical protein OAI26_01950 [Sulfitobacter sp.]|nr:hypothetical protein [Sulfitobacter sp.]